MSTERTVAPKNIRDVMPPAPGTYDGKDTLAGQPPRFLGPPVASDGHGPGWLLGGSVEKLPFKDQTETGDTLPSARKIFHEAVKAGKVGNTHLRDLRKEYNHDRKVGDIPKSGTFRRFVYDLFGL